jgi:hypothetical protein
LRCGMLDSQNKKGMDTRRECGGLSAGRQSLS